MKVNKKRKLARQMQTEEERGKRGGPYNNNKAWNDRKVARIVKVKNIELKAEKRRKEKSKFKVGYDNSKLKIKTIK